MILPLNSAKNAFADNEPLSVTLRFFGKETTFVALPEPEPDFTITTDFHQRRINASYDEKMECIDKSLSLGASVKSAILYTLPRLEKTVTEFISSVDCEPIDATMTFKPYNKPMFTISAEKEGYKINEQRLYYDIYLALKKSSSAVIEAKAERLEPTVTANELKKYTELRSSFSTDYSSSNENRKHNIRLALSKLNGKKINAGEEFSFNATVGKRTISNGFSDAKIIVDGEYVDGTGGGVCQASTTLYNCAILGDMKVTSVRAHSLPPSYVPPSFDAMVNSGTSDFKFINSSSGPVFIRAYGNDTSAVVQLYGEKLSYEIKRESVVVSRTAIPEDKTIIDEKNEYDTATLLPGESKRVRYGASGLCSEGYLYYYKNGKLIDKKLIRKDTYRPIQGLIALPKASGEEDLSSSNFATL